MNNYPQLKNELLNLQDKLKDPAIFSSQEYPKMAKRMAELEGIIKLFDTQKKPRNSHPTG